MASDVVSPSCRDQYGAIWYRVFGYAAVAVYGDPSATTKDGRVQFAVTLYTNRTANPADGYDRVYDYVPADGYSDAALWSAATDGVAEIGWKIKNAPHLLKWDVLAKLPTCQDLPHYAGGQADTSKGYSIGLDGLGALLPWAPPDCMTADRKEALWLAGTPVSPVLKTLWPWRAGSTGYSARASIWVYAGGVEPNTYNRYDFEIAWSRLSHVFRVSDPPEQIHQYLAALAEDDWNFELWTEYSEVPPTDVPTCEQLGGGRSVPRDTSTGYSIDLDGLGASKRWGLTNLPPVGARVVFHEDLERYPNFTVPAGTTGTVVASDENSIGIKVDQHVDGLTDSEWEGVADWYAEDEDPDYGPVDRPFHVVDDSAIRPDESKGYGIDLNGLRGSDQDVQAGFEVSIEHQDVIADNVRDRFSDPSPERDDAIREDLIDANAEITEHGWEQLNEDILRLETNATRWLRETFNGARVDGHDSTDTLVGSIWFNPYDTKQAELIELASPSPGRSEWIDMDDSSYGDLADTVFEGVSDFGQSALAGRITFFGVPPEAWAVIKGAVEDASGGYQIDLNGLGAVARQPELAPPQGTVAYGRLLKELRAVDPEVRLVHASASQIAFRAELTGNDPLREKAGYPARGPAATVVIYDLERKDTQNLERLLAQWAAVENPPRLLLAPAQGTNIEWLRQYAVWPGGLGQVSMDADDELVYGGSDQEPDEDEVEDESEDDDGSDAPEECNHDPSRFFGIDDGWYDLTTNNTEDEIERAANGVGGISFGRTGRSQGKYDVYHPWVQPQNCSGGDYDNCGLVCKSNHRVLVEACNNALKEDDTCQLPWFVELYGGHGSYGILIHARRAPDSIAEMLAGLSDYPLLDESDHSELEMESRQEAWSDWGRDDYRRALEKAFSDAGFEYDFDDVEDAELDRHFDEIANEIGEYWQDDGGSMYIDVEKVAKSAAEDNDLPEGAKAAAADEDDSGSGAPPSQGYAMDLDGVGSTTYRPRR